MLNDIAKMNPSKIHIEYLTTILVNKQNKEHSRLDCDNLDCAICPYTGAVDGVCGSPYDTRMVKADLSKVKKVWEHNKCVN